MFKKFLYNRMEISIEGLNIKRLIKNFYKNGIDLYEFNLLSHKNLVVTISVKDYKKKKKLLGDYRVTITKRYGLSFLKNFSLTRVGVILGFVAFLVLSFFNNNYISKIFIYGNNKISSTEIKETLKNNGVSEKTFFNNINVENLEVELENSFEEISFVSVIKKGTNILINIKEKLFTEDSLASNDIISPVLGQIVSMEVVSGTPLRKVGDTIKKGDAIVGGYLESEGKKVLCNAIAKISLRVWYSSSVEFFEVETKIERTGNMIEQAYYEIFNKKIPVKSVQKLKKSNKKEAKSFEKYEKEQKTYYLFENNLLPIKIVKEKIYEIQETFVKNDFLSQKDAIIDKTKKEALEKVPNDKEILDIKTDITDFEFGKIVTTYIETMVEI